MQRHGDQEVISGLPATGLHLPTSDTQGTAYSCLQVTQPQKKESVDNVAQIGKDDPESFVLDLLFLQKIE